MSWSTERSKKRDEREGSPWTGLTAVLTKEMADQLTGARVLILEVLVLLTAVGTVYTALKSINTTDDNQFLYLSLFTTAQDPLPPFVFFLAILVPLIAIALSFDSINGEFNRRTLSRVLAQPVYRDGDVVLHRVPILGDRRAGIHCGVGVLHLLLEYRGRDRRAAVGAAADY